MCEEILAEDMNFIFTCLETSHTGLYDWLKYLDGIAEFVRSGNPTMQRTQAGEVKKLEIKHWNKNSREVYSYMFSKQRDIIWSITLGTLLDF
jgi:hypothetical protein